MHEPRRRFALSGQHFSAPAERGTRTAQACSSLTGGEFFAEIQRGAALCGAREIAAPAAGANRKGHLRFPFLFELLPFPCFLIWRRFPICDRFENGVRQRIFSSVSFTTCSQCQITYCYTGGQLYAGATYPCCAIRERVVIDRACEDTLYQTPNSQVPCGITRYRVAQHGYVAPA